MVNGIETGQQIERICNPEYLKVEYIRPIDVSKEKGMAIILEMLKHPANREHLADINENTTVDDLKRYYMESGRYGYVGLSPTEGLVGVYDLTGPELNKGRISGVTPEVELTAGFVNKLCVRTDLQRRGVGTQLLQDAVRRSHNDFKWLILFAGIVLDEESSDRIEQAQLIEDKTAEANVYTGLEEKDARVKLFIHRLGFVNRGSSPNVRVAGRPRHVLMVTHRDPWLTEGSKLELV